MSDQHPSEQVPEYGQYVPRQSRAARPAGPVSRATRTSRALRAACRQYPPPGQQGQYPPPGQFGQYPPAAGECSRLPTPGPGRAWRTFSVASWVSSPL
ncbi:hypothetical protein NKG05_25025 [Oerskovia sp. M15]